MDAVEYVYYEEFIKKRELKDRWVQFWAKLLSEKIYLYVSRDCKQDDFCEIIWLSSCSRCVLLKRRNYSFRFRLNTRDGSYYFKCDSNLQRHRWIHMIHLACSGRSPEIPPNHINMRCCCRDRERNDIGCGKGITQSAENNNDERVTETSEGKETICEKKSSNSSLKGASIEKIAEMEFGDSKTNKNKGSENSEESFKPEVTTMTDTKEVSKDSENRTKEEKCSSVMANNKSCESSTSACFSDKESPATKQTFSFRAFTFGSFRKSLKRQSYPPKREKEPAQSEEQSSVSYPSIEDKIRYSMDNPAFTDDDIETTEESLYADKFQTPKIINVATCQ